MHSTIKIMLLIAVLFSCKSEDPEGMMLPEVIEPTPAMDQERMDYIMGHFDPATHPDFILIEEKYADRSGLYLHKEAYADFIKMHDAAEADGVDLQIRSATRNFDYQKGIWERKWNGTTTLSDGTKASDIADSNERALKILLYSSMPGSSRHHWGTDVDFNSFSNSYFESGKGLKEYEWLTENGPSYGFCQSYTDKTEGRTGYEEEKWHWTYMPISKELTDYAAEYMTDDMIQGFAGSETAPVIHVVQNYVLGINPACR